MADLHPNILTYLAAIAAFNANDLRTVGDHVRSDVVYRIPGRSIVAGEFHGIDGFADILTRLRDESGGTIELTPLAVLADDHNLIARARVPPNEPARTWTPRTATPSGSSTAKSPTDRSSSPTPTRSTTSGPAQSNPLQPAPGTSQRNGGHHDVALDVVDDP
jgi:hypothetical protein